MHNITICTILQYAQYYNMHNIAICTILQYAQYAGCCRNKFYSGSLDWRSAQDFISCRKITQVRTRPQSLHFLKNRFLWEWMHFCDYYVCQCLKKQKSSGNNSSLHETTNGLAHFQKPFRRFYNLICKP